MLDGLNYCRGVNNNYCYSTSKVCTPSLELGTHVQPSTTNQVANRLVNTLPLAAITASGSRGYLSHSQLWHSQRLSERSCKQHPIVIRRRRLPARQMSAAATAPFRPLARWCIEPLHLQLNGAARLNQQLGLQHLSV